MLGILLKFWNVIENVAKHLLNTVSLFYLMVLRNLDTSSREQIGKLSRRLSCRVGSHVYERICIQLSKRDLRYKLRTKPALWKNHNCANSFVEPKRLLPFHPSSARNDYEPQPKIKNEQKRLYSSKLAHNRPGLRFVHLSAGRFKSRQYWDSRPNMGVHWGSTNALKRYRFIVESAGKQSLSYVLFLPYFLSVLEGN